MYSAMNPAAAAAAAAAARHPVSPALPVRTPFYFQKSFNSKTYVLAIGVSPWREKCSTCRRARNPVQGRVNTLTLQPH